MRVPRRAASRDGGAGLAPRSPASSRTVSTSARPSPGIPSRPGRRSDRGPGDVGGGAESGKRAPRRNGAALLDEIARRASCGDASRRKRRQRGYLNHNCRKRHSGGICPEPSESASGASTSSRACLSRMARARADRRRGVRHRRAGRARRSRGSGRRGGRAGREQPASSSAPKPSATSRAAPADSERCPRRARAGAAGNGRSPIGPQKLINCGRVSTWTRSMGPRPRDRRRSRSSC